MKAFTFVRPETAAAAASAVSVTGSVLKAGGIDLLDRMKERVDEPERVVWLGALNDAKLSDPRLTQIDMPPVTANGVAEASIGSMVTLAQLAESKALRAAFPALAQAAGLAASPQLRLRATIGGNLAQHTRCGYYRHRSFPCVKRGDPACPALADGGVQDTAAIFDNSLCASALPSSLAPVLCAHNAYAGILLPDGTSRDVPLRSLFARPTRGVAADLVLPPGAVIWRVFLRGGGISAYEEVRQKAAFDWALVSVCVQLYFDSNIGGAAIWLGSVAPTPWHAEAAEKTLVGKPLTDETIAAAADAAVLGATPLPGNAYKVDLVKVVVRRALTRLRDMK